MENHINKLSPKILSLHGKVTLLNTLILSKTTYLINIFPLDGITTSRIHKNKFQYIWNIQKLESIARKTISLKKKTRGGEGSKPNRTRSPQLCYENKAFIRKTLQPIVNNGYSQIFKTFNSWWTLLWTLNNKKPFCYQDIIN